MVEIQTQHWQPALNNLGAIVTDLDDIGQAIQIILTTEKGSVPFRPEFGVDIMPYLDRPVQLAAPQLVREAWAAIEEFEPRAVITSIDVAMPAIGHLEFTVAWAPVDGTEQQVTSVEVAI